MTNNYTLHQFIDDELESGVDFVEILEYFNLSAGDVFQLLFESGLIDEDLLKAYLIDL